MVVSFTGLALRRAWDGCLLVAVTPVPVVADVTGEVVVPRGSLGTYHRYGRTALCSTIPTSPGGTINRTDGTSVSDTSLRWYFEATALANAHVSPRSETMLRNVDPCS